MIYPQNFESKIGFEEIRFMLREACISTLGMEKVDDMKMMVDATEITDKLNRVREFRLFLEENSDFPMNYFLDMRKSVSRLRMENTYLEEKELFDLRRSLDTIDRIKRALMPETIGLDGDAKYPHLQMLADGVITFPQLVKKIDQILDKFGKMRDSASSELTKIRKELKQAENSVSHILYGILRQAQQEGLVSKDVNPTVRDGRLMIPVPPALKRRIPGIVHDESATGKTSFIEPTQVVEANNRIRELETAEKKEIVRILTEFAKIIRPDVRYIVASYSLLAHIDFLNAKLQLAEKLQAAEPQIKDEPMMDLIEARHPLLQISLKKHGKTISPLSIVLNNKDRILIISGPNAGGKSVCLKTTGLLQYMFQCGLPIPAKENSTCGVFKNIMIDIGDEQSIEDDLSTYSSHLKNMRTMMKVSDDSSLLLIDEFGAGTEPLIGGAIAEAVLKQFWEKGVFAVITTHYQNLKHFADNHKGVVNGAMLYDRHEMQALFQLQIGRPGSSFAIEIARKTGIPEEVIKDASDIVGREYIQSDKFLQDIVRDKRYWESKRDTIHKREKEMQRTINRYETNINDIEQERKEIIKKAKEQANEILRESNRRIENVIREIKEQQAEKEATKKIREELNSFRNELQNIDHKTEDEKISKKIEQIKARRQRHERRKAEKKQKEMQSGSAFPENQPFTKEKPKKEQFVVSDTVRIKGLSAIGTIEIIEDNIATIIFGDMRTKMRTDRLEKAKASCSQDTNDTYKHAELNQIRVSKSTRDAIDKRRSGFSQELDVRGMRGDEALNAVMYYIDDAILVGVQQVRILHGKGNGILKQLIRQYLKTVPNITSFRDELVQFGGAGITVVEF
jgi:DNA mismatch repair protein MutS2